MPIYKGTTEIVSGKLYKASTVIQDVYKASDEVYTNVTMPAVNTGQVAYDPPGSQVYGAGVGYPAAINFLAQVQDSGNDSGTYGIYLGTDPVYSNNSKHGISWSFSPSDGIVQGGSGNKQGNWWTYTGTCQSSFPITLYANAWIINSLGVEVVGSQTTVTIPLSACPGCPAC